MCWHLLNKITKQQIKSPIVDEIFTEKQQRIGEQFFLRKELEQKGKRHKYCTEIRHSKKHENFHAEIGAELWISNKIFEFELNESPIHFLVFR